jgi:hypothetical protein
VHRLDRIERTTCRKSFEERFSVERMVDGYLELYAAVIAHADARPSQPQQSVRGEP